MLTVRRGATNPELTRGGATPRGGGTIIELLVGVVMLGIIGAATASTLVQQGRVRTRVAWRLAADAQMREAAAPIISDAGAVSPAASDLDPAHATDTSIVMRTTAGEGFVCALDAADSMTARVIMLSPVRGRSIAAGDSAWAYHAGAWTASVIEQVAADAAAPCAPAGPSAGAPLKLTFAGETPPVPGAPLRFTRRVRYSLYRAGDGETYLGLREWSPGLGAFAGQQPVAGPLSRTGSGFHYIDSLGNRVIPSPATLGRLAQVGVDLQAPAFPWGFVSGPAPRLSLSAPLRNRR